MMPTQFKTWLAFGSGIGIEISGPRDSESISATAVRVRPTGARVIGKLEIENFTHQLAGVWGTEFSNFARRAGMRHVGATVILPRHEVIVRQLSLPGVSAKDLDAAIGFQLDGLHPYPEEDVTASWSRLGGSDTVLIAITRRAVIDRYATLFAEAGIKIACFTCSAAVIYSALRLFDAAPAAQILAADVAPSHIEIYGESSTRPLFSATFGAQGDAALDRAAALARAELRIHSENGPDPAAAPIPFEDLLRAAPALAVRRRACIRLARDRGLAVNLLPQSQRQASSPARILLIPLPQWPARSSYRWPSRSLRFLVTKIASTFDRSKPRSRKCSRWPSAPTRSIAAPRPLVKRFSSSTISAAAPNPIWTCCRK